MKTGTDHKRASDAWDLFPLLDAHGGDESFGAAFGAAPEGLRSLVAAAVERFFRHEVTRTRRWILVYGQPEWAAQVDEDALVDVAELFARAIRD